ncbi:hypothetical protein ACFV8T_03530 [Streptomyces sp. NPDC059832]|uniref:hypothetical protein n=1 Tax=Streptomyces sp. NPDC059832 TaxID=3346966 RepID=UPI00365D412D
MTTGMSRRALLMSAAALAAAGPLATTTAQVRFRYTDGNNWFWAIHGVTLTPA